MHDEAEQPVDKNSRGAGLALRSAGALLPLVAFWAIFLNPRFLGSPGAEVSSLFKVIAFLWAWPYGVYRVEPFAFSALALVGVIFVAVLGFRRDWRGALSVLIWCFFWGWLMAVLIGQD